MGKYIAEIPDNRILFGDCYIPDERDEPIPVEKVSDWLRESFHIIEEEEAGIPVCSNCGAVQPEDHTVYYCWNCGAKHSS